MEEYSNFKDKERLQEFRAVLRTLAFRMSVPLYLFFWISDWAYAPYLVWELLCVRVGVVVTTIALVLLSQKTSKLLNLQLIALVIMAANALPIGWMTVATGGPQSIYFQGLNLAVLGSLAFIPWTPTFAYSCLAITYAPVYINFLSGPLEGENLTHLIVNSFFAFSVSTVSLVIRKFNERLRVKELQARFDLQNRVEQLVGEQIDLKEKASLFQLSTQVAHDIRSPISALEVLLTQANRLDPQTASLGRMAVNRIREIANELLEKYRPKRHRNQTPEPMADDVGALIEEVISEKKLYYLNQNDVSVEFTYDPNQPKISAAIPARDLKRIISNLIDNGAEATQGRGKVWIELLRTPTLCQITICDNGIGFPKEALAKLGKEEFSTKGAKGHGIGLFYCVNVIKKYGGNITIESKTSRKTHIAFAIPLRPPQ